jgi:hypothetical protein
MEIQDMAQTRVCQHNAAVCGDTEVEPDRLTFDPDVYAAFVGTDLCHFDRFI